MRLDHPYDKRLHAVISSDAVGPVVEVYFLGEPEPTIRFDAVDGWEPGARAMSWQALEILIALGFTTVVDVALLLEGEGKTKSSPRIRRIAEVVEALNLAGE